MVNKLEQRAIYMSQAGDPVPDMFCNKCGEQYVYEKDFHPRGGGRLVPGHRCQAQGGAMFGIKRIVRTLQ